MLVSIIVPVFNERYFVAPLLERVLAAPLPPGCRSEVVVVDDGSDDGTSQVVAALAARHPGQLRMLQRPRREGKGAAVQTALTQVQGEVCILQDADLEFDPSDYPDLLAPIVAGQADVVVGSRFFPHRWRRVPHYWRTVYQRHLNSVVNLVADLTLSDSLSGLQAFRTEVMRTIPLRCRGFDLVPELVVKAGKRRLRVFEVPVSYHGRLASQGSKRRRRDAARDLLAVLRFALVDDLYAGDIGDEILTDISRAHRFNRWMATAIRPWIGHRVLEIGAGIGTITQQLLPRDHYVASDNEPRHLAVLRSMALGQPQVEVAHVDAEHPDHFAALAGAFDSVLCLNVLEHIPDAGTALGNMASCLAPGGRLVILVPQGRWLYSPLDRALQHVCRYDKGQLVAAIAAQGLQVLRTFDFNRAGVLGWALNGVLLRRTRMARFQLKIFDQLVALWRLLDRLLPWPGLSLVVVAEKPGAASPGAHAISSA